MQTIPATNRAVLTSLLDVSQDEYSFSMQIQEFDSNCVVCGMWQENL